MNNNEQKKNFLLKKPFFFWVRLFLGIIFVYASVDKIIHPAAFAKAVYNYQILPGELINFAAITLPWVELLLGVFLILGVWLPGATSLTTLLLAIFLGALLFNVARGLNVNCGCFSASNEAVSATSMVWYLLRDIVFLLLALYLFSYVFLRKERRAYVSLSE